MAAKTAERVLVISSAVSFFVAHESPITKKLFSSASSFVRCRHFSLLIFSIFSRVMQSWLTRQIASSCCQREFFGASPYAGVYNKQVRNIGRRIFGDTGSDEEPFNLLLIILETTMKI
nr:hypothetical protein [Candidatus Electrothrix aestuarii]